MSQPKHTEDLILLHDQMAVCQLPPNSSIPEWVVKSSFWSITRTSMELSLVVSQEMVPANLPCEPGWRAFCFSGPLAFNQIGILARAVVPLAEAQVSVFVLSTYDTDYLMVKENQLSTALVALKSAGYRLNEETKSP
jgi:uncharacterized protein